MKKTIETKVEMKENLLAGNSLELNDAELEGAAGGRDTSGFERRMKDALNRGCRFNTEDPYKDIMDLDQARWELEHSQNRTEGNGSIDMEEVKARVEQDMQRQRDSGVKFPY